MRVQTIAVGFVALVLSCAALEPLASNTCGNGVIDANEDCDSFPAAQCGAPSAGEAKCRLLCGKQASGELLACPDGWGCSVSGFCRQPTGTFSPSSEPVSAGVTTMLVGDFDGDGRQDVLGSSGPTSKGRIHYFKDGSAPQVVALPGVLASPVVLDVDADGRSDIAFGYTFRGVSPAQNGDLEPSFAGGYAILVGQVDRAVVTKLFPSITQERFDAFIVHAAASKPADLPDRAGGGLLAVATFKTAQGASGTLLRSLEGGDFGDLTQGLVRPLPGVVGDLAGEPVAARIFDDALKSTCGEVVVPFNIAGSALVQVYSPCVRVALKVEWSNMDPPKQLSFAGEILTRIFVTDVNTDGHADIVIGTTLSNGKSKTRVAYGNGIDLTVMDAPLDLTDVPLAAGFLDADECLDFVVPTGVLLSTRGKALIDAGAPDGGVMPPSTCAKQQWINVPPPTKSWTVAKIADVNRDGANDVIAASQFEPDIDVLEGTRGVNMPPFSISTTGSVTKVSVGDFDFDGNGDIAFVQARPASSEREIAIAYGRALTMPPESPRLAGRLDGIRQLLVGAQGITITTATPSKTADELPSFSLAVLLASGERQPVAPLLFVEQGGAPNGGSAGTVRRELQTRALVASPASTPGAIDLSGLVQQTDYTRLNGKRESEPSYGVWVAPGTGPTSFIAPSKQFELPNLPAVDRATDSFLVQLVSGDLDGDKKEEIVVVSPDSSGAGAQLFVIRPGRQEGLPQSVPIPERTAPGGVRSQLLDVDGDGKVDLVAILTNGQKKRAEVNVFFGDGKAGFAIPGMVVKLPQREAASFDDYTALGFAQITTGGGLVGGAGGKRRELAIVTPRHLFRAFVKADRSIDIEDAASPFGVISYGSAVVAGDFDGDGVEDLAVADQGSIRIARQLARLR